MNAHLAALWLMAAQGCLGAFDTLFHHELTVALPRQDSAGRELAIHALRAIIYSCLFVGLSFWTWNGLLAVALFAVFIVEILLTLWDFVVEDRTRLLPATERVVHTILAINGGAFIALLAVCFPAWWPSATGFGWEPHGCLSLFLALCGVGVGASGIRDAFAAARIGRRSRLAAEVPVAFSTSMTPLTVLVSGGTGFIGFHLVWALLRDGHDVTVLTRRPKQAAWRFNGRVRCVRALDELPATMGFDIVINLAGAPILGPPWTERRKAVIVGSRLGVTQALVSWIAAAERKPRLFLSASGVTYYGTRDVNDDSALDEAASSPPGFISEICLRWEQAAYRAEAHGVKVVCMRLGLVFGRKGALPMLLLPIRLGFGGRLGRGRQWLSWIHIDDVIAAMAYLMRSGAAEGPYNFTAPEAVRQLQFSQIAAQVLRRPCVFPTPAAPLRLLMGEQSSLMLEGQRVAPKRLIDSGFQFRYPRVREALQSLT